jgi:hypothetical protein
VGLGLSGPARERREGEPAGKEEYRRYDDELDSEEGRVCQKIAVELAFPELLHLFRPFFFLRLEYIILRRAGQLSERQDGKGSLHPSNRPDT